MPGIDWQLVTFAGTQVALVLTAFATFVSGFSIRYGLRAAGGARSLVRLSTTVTWAVVFVVTGRVFLPPLETDLERTAYRVALAASGVILAFYLAGLNRIRRAIDRRATQRVAMFAAISDAFGRLPEVASAEDREALSRSLAELDRFVEPATFEYIQLARSRIASWLDGGPRAAEREERWAARMSALEATLRPASWWDQDQWSRFGQRIGAAVRSAASVVAAVCGIVVGRSMLSEPIGFVMPAAIVAGYLLTWEWAKSVAPLLAGAAVGVGATAIVQGTARRADTVASTVAIVGALTIAAAFEWRRAHRRPNLHVVPSSEGGVQIDPRAS